VVNMRFVKPLDDPLLRELAPQHLALVTLEENVVAGGAGSAVAEFLDLAGYAQPRLFLGLPDRFIEHGSREQCLASAGLDASTVVGAIERWWQIQSRGLNGARAAPKMAVVGRPGLTPAANPGSQPPKQVTKT
jgi:1-deoxy-D-xylulose-5-phosphate synthase